MKKCAQSNINLHLLCLMLCLSSLGCFNSNDHIPIDKSLKTTNLQNDTSIFCMPIEISMAEIEKNVNQKVKHKLLVDKKGDNNITISVVRAGHINFSGKNNKVQISLPVNVKVLKKTKINQFNVNFTIDIIIVSDLEIMRNWQIRSKSHIERIIWRDNPTLDILGMDFDIKRQVEKALNNKKGKIAQSVDDVIQRELKIKKHLDLIWFNMQKPNNIIKKTGDEIFLFITPSSVSYQSHNITDKHIVVNVTSQATFSLSSSYDKDVRSPLPKLKYEKTDCQGFDISMLAELKFKDINQKINLYLKGKSTTVEGYKIKFKHAFIQPSGQDLHVKLDIEGAVEGTLAGLVSIGIDTANHNILGTLSRFEVVNGDIKLELANLILGDFIANELGKFGLFNYKEYLKEMPIFIQDGIEQGKSGDKWHPVFDEMHTQLQHFEITEQAIYLLLSGKGDGRIVIDKMKMK